MITENTRKQLADYRKHGKKLKYLINYLMGLIDDEDDFESSSEMWEKDAMRRFSRY